MSRGFRYVSAMMAALIALAGCSGSEPAPQPSPTPTATPTPAQPPSGPRSLVAADFGSLQLGAKIKGPAGNTVNASLVHDGHAVADLVSYVACPQDMQTCDPKTAPEGTIYTYVLKVTPDYDTLNDDAMGHYSGAPLVGDVTGFHTGNVAPGFQGSIGYDMDEAMTALGSADAIGVADDNGKLAWRVVGGDGWKAGKTITFFWQSTAPPAGPADAYRLTSTSEDARGKGPFPAPEPVAKPSAPGKTR